MMFYICMKFLENIFKFERFSSYSGHDCVTDKETDEQTDRHQGHKQYVPFLSGGDIQMQFQITYRCSLRVGPFTALVKHYSKPHMISKPQCNKAEGSMAI